jgi:hypothetical protein
MKRLALVVLAFIGSLIVGACQEKLEWEISIDIASGNTETREYFDLVEYEEIMALDKGNSQGGDSWGDYFIQFTSNAKVRIYDLSTKTLVQTINLTGSLKGFVSNCHCNTVCFGTEYYEAEDYFPLIYVSTGYAQGGYSGALVYRITEHDGTFFITLVQTIKFPYDESSWTEFVPGGEFAYLCYTSQKVIYKIPMPKLKDGNHIISKENAIETYQFTPQPDWMSSSRNQDWLFYQGKILYITGVPQVGEVSALVILNLETLTRDKIINFKRIGLTSEPESIFIWQGDICVAFADKIVKLIEFIDTP